MTVETFGQVLRRLRVERGISQNQMAVRAEVDAAYVHRMESGRSYRRDGELHIPGRAIVESLARALWLSPLDTDRLLISAGYWPWPDQPEDVERALAAVHGDLYGERRKTG